jgi:hypothetical protein
LASDRLPLTSLYIGDTQPDEQGSLWWDPAVGNLKVQYSPEGDTYAAATQAAIPATSIIETSGPTTLTIDDIADGDWLQRSGTTVIGSNPRFALQAFYAKPVVVTATPYAVASTDHTMLVDLATIGGAGQVNLPAATGSGRILIVKFWTASGGSTVKAHPDGTDSIDGTAADLTISTLYQSYTLQDVASGKWAIL